MVSNPNNIARHGSYAFFPGTGPKGRVCGDCGMLITFRGKVYCRRFADITGKRGAPISADTSSCREFARAERTEIMKS